MVPRSSSESRMFLRVFLRRLTSCLRRAQRGSFRKSFPSRKSTQVARAILYKVRAAFASGEASAHSSGERHLPNPSLELDAGLTSSDAAKRIEFGPYGEWRAPARLYMNVERAYREFRNEPPNAPWDSAATFEAVYQVAKAKGIEAEF